MKNTKIISIQRSTLFSSTKGLYIDFSVTFIILLGVMRNIFFQTNDDSSSLLHGVFANCVLKLQDIVSLWIVSLYHKSTVKLSKKQQSCQTHKTKRWENLEWFKINYNL